MDNLKVSVIIPVYNSQNSIFNALNSIKEQTYSNIEVIIINDGSSDESNNVIKEFIRNNSEMDIKYIIQENSGVSISRNNGILISKGEFIAFLDSDDKWEPNKLQEQIDIFNSNNQICLIGTKVYTSKMIRKEMIGDIDEINFYKLLFKNYFVTSSVLIRRKVLDTVGLFIPNQNYSEDFNLWLRIAYHFKCVVLNKQLTYYDINNTGLSSKLFRMEFSELLNFLDLYKSRKINIFTLVFISVFSIIKFLRRVAYQIILGK